MSSYVSLAIFVALIGFIFWLFVRRRRLREGLDRFIAANGLRALGSLPPEAQEADIPNAQAFSGQVEHAGRAVAFLFLSGWSTSVTSTGASTQSSLSVHHAIILPADDANFRVEARCRAAMEKKSAWRDFFVFNTQRPLKVARLSGHRLLVCWNGLHTEKVWREKLDFLRSVLD